MFGESRLVKSVKLLPIKSNIKISTHTEPYAYIIYIFVVVVDLLLLFLFINFLIFFGMCSTPKLSKQEALLFRAYKATQWVPIPGYLSRFVTYAYSLFYCDTAF